MLIETMNYGAVAQGKLVSTTGGQLEPVLRSKGQMCTAVSGAPSRMGPMFRSAPQAVHTVVPEQAVVPICVPEQCMLVLSVAGTWRSDWRHVLASMANTKHTAPVGRSSSPPIAWCGCCADFCFQHCPPRKGFHMAIANKMLNGGLAPKLQSIKNRHSNTAARWKICPK